MVLGANRVGPNYLPWPSDIPDEVYSQTPRRNVIDDPCLASCAG